MSLNFIFMFVIAGIASVFYWHHVRMLNCPWSFERGILCSFFILVCTLGLGCLIMYAFSTEYTVVWNPEQTVRVVLYKLPYISLTPQQIGDGPGFAEVYSAQGYRLDQIYFEQIQSAQVTWFNDFVEVGSVSVWYE